MKFGMVPCCCVSEPTDCRDICSSGNLPWVTVSVSGWGGTCNQGFDNCCSLANGSFNVFPFYNVSSETCEDATTFCAGFSRVSVEIYEDTGTSEYVLAVTVLAANQFAVCSASAIYEKRWSNSSTVDCSSWSSLALTYRSGSLVTNGTPCTGGDSLTVTVTTFGPP